MTSTSNIREVVEGAIVQYCPEYNYISKKALTKDFMFNVLGVVFPGLAAYNGFVSSAQLNIVTNRLNELSDIVLNLIDVNEVNYFTHHKILTKYISDTHVLDEKLQIVVSNYLIECKNDKSYDDAVNWLLKTPTYKINNCLSTRFDISFARGNYYLTAAVDDYVNNVLKELGNFKPLFSTYGGGNLKNIEVSPLGITIYKDVLALFSDIMIHRIDHLNKINVKYREFSRENRVVGINLTSNEYKKYQELLKYVNSEHIIASDEEEKFEEICALIKKSQKTNNNIYIKFNNNSEQRLIRPHSTINGKKGSLNELEIFSNDIEKIIRKEEVFIETSEYTICWTTEEFTKANSHSNLLKVFSLLELEHYLDTIVIPAIESSMTK